MIWWTLCYDDRSTRCTCRQSRGDAQADTRKHTPRVVVEVAPQALIVISFNSADSLQVRLYCLYSNEKYKEVYPGTTNTVGAVLRLGRGSDHYRPLSLATVLPRLGSPLRPLCQSLTTKTAIFPVTLRGLFSFCFGLGVSLGRCGVVSVAFALLLLLLPCLPLCFFLSCVRVSHGVVVRLA